VSGTASASFALVIDRETQELQVERSADGEDFEVVHSFETSSGYRQLVAGGDPPALFVTGYTFNPRTWNVAYSLDAGETWSETSPEVDNDYATMVPRLVDPEARTILLFQAETTLGVGHEVWSFDAENESAERVLHMEEGEIYGGMTLNGDALWVAGRRRGAGAAELGSLYRADRQDLEFERVVDEAPPFSCLDAFDGALFGCVNNVTYASNFMLGRSTDEGQSWEPHITLADLGSLQSCGRQCCATLEWLTGDYGVPGAAGVLDECGAGGADTGGSGGAGGSGGMGGTGGADPGPAGAGNEPERPASSSDGGCRCAQAGGVSSSPLTLAGFVALCLFARRKRPFHCERLG
jgi:hypothetical protein